MNSFLANQGEIWLAKVYEYGNVKVRPVVIVEQTEYKTVVHKITSTNSRYTKKISGTGLHSKSFEKKKKNYIYNEYLILKIGNKRSE